MEKRKLLSWIIILFLALGIFAIFLESEFEVAEGIRAGAGLLGIASILWGVEEFTERSVLYSFSWEKSEREMTIKTIASIAVSLLRLLIGIGLVTISLLGFLGLGDPAASFIKTRPGFAMVFFSSLGLIYGAQQFLMVKKYGKGLRIFLENISGRIFGVFLILVSILVLILGLMEIFWPEGFVNLIRLVLLRFGLSFILQ
jgi:hypothetical protein